MKIMKKKFTNKEILYIGIFLLIIFFLIGFLFGGNKKEKVPAEYLAALGKATVYANELNMSKKNTYKQLTSEIGEKFPENAAKYAIENVTADWKENAFKKALVYQKEVNMSKKAIYEQLINEDGENFTEEEAEYALRKLSQF